MLAEVRMHMPGSVSLLATAMPKRRLEQAVHDSVHPPARISFLVDNITAQAVVVVHENDLRRS